MRVVVCVKPTQDGDIGPFCASAYEAALSIPGAEVILLAMARQTATDVLLRLTRLGARQAYLLCDKAFAGADTLATSYVLSLALKKLCPDIVICGRQSVDGDTAQVGIGVATKCGYSLATRIMQINSLTDTGLACTTRSGEKKELTFPALLTVERFCELRLPTLRSRVGEVITLNADELGANKSLCGLDGSPTRVVRSFENQSGRRSCKRINFSEFDNIIGKCMSAREEYLAQSSECKNPLKNVWVYGEKALPFAESISDDIRLCELTDAKSIAEQIKAGRPSAVLWDSSDKAKELAATVAVLLQTGLCADCTLLETDGEQLYMYRPAFSGNIIAKIRCTTQPPMATVRTKTDSADIIFSVGMGAVKHMDKILELAKKYGAEICATRAVVNGGYMKYEHQVGLTGKSVAPKVYVAFGISGAVHHLAGISGAGKIIAVNNDKNAPIFDFADYGIVCDIKDAGGDAVAF